MSKYTVKYFIEFFSAIPDEKWTVGGRHDCRKSGIGCALNHANSHSEAAADSLVGFFNRSEFYVVDVNDLITGRFPQTTPKARILAALAHIQKSFDNCKK